MRLLKYKQWIYVIQIQIVYILKNKHWDKLDKGSLVGKNLLQGKNVYKDGGIFYGFSLAPKKNNV